MIPTIGDIVLYHFKHTGYDDVDPERRANIELSRSIDYAVRERLLESAMEGKIISRPAIVLEVYEDVSIDVMVMFTPFDRVNGATVDGPDTVYRVPPHQERTERGVVELMPVLDHTWSRRKVR